jgi:hypothetical protein
MLKNGMLNGEKGLVEIEFVEIIKIETDRCKEIFSSQTFKLVRFVDIVKELLILYILHLHIDD